MAKNKSSNRKKRFLIFVCAVAVIVLLVTGANIVSVNNLLEKGGSYSRIQVEDQLVPQKDGNGNWYFTTDRDFRVMHITDIHIGGGFMTKTVDEKALNAIALMVTKEKPDLVIATGDIAFPVPYRAGTFNNRCGAKAFANLMENLGVYWDVTFGNHDAEAYSYFNRKAMADFYENEEFKYCLFQSGPEDVDGKGNHVIEVKNSEGIITQAMVLIDSQAYVDNSIIESIKGNYDNIHTNQIEWYEKEILRMNAENEKISNKSVPVKSLAFFHIPLTEMLDGWTEFTENGYKDTENFRFIDGIMGEGGKIVYCGSGEDEMFEKMLELGSTKAMFNGHDHLNSTTFDYKGIQFSYGYSVDYFAYSGIDELGSQRGCTMITCKPDSSFSIDKYNFYSDRYDVEGFGREEVTMQFEGASYRYAES
ncbi:MAG: metallophosphoesterase [Clostridia bacterium]|nr:metallophosphoesterase [Clostridia bacterium]